MENNSNITSSTVLIEIQSDRRPAKVHGRGDSADASAGQRRDVDINIGNAFWYYYLCPKVLSSNSLDWKSRLNGTL